MELREYLSIARRWAWLLVLGVVLGAAGGLAASLIQTPVYQASTRILALRASQGTASDQMYVTPQDLANTYIQLLTTTPVLDGAAQQLGYPVSAGQLKLQTTGYTGIINLTVEDPDPARAAAIANALVASLIDQNQRLQAGQYAETEQSLQEQITQTQTQIAALQAQVSQVSTQTVQDQLASLKAQIDPLQEEVTNLQKDMASRQPSSSLTNRTKVAEDKARLDQIQPLLSLYQQIYSNLVVLGKPSDVANSQSTQLTQLQSTLDLYQQVYINLLSSLQTVRLARLQSTPSVVQIEEATQPSSPIRPRPLTNTLLAGMVGLMLAGAIVFLVEYLDNTLKTPEDVERVLGLPVIGYVANMQYPDGSDEGIYVVRQPRSPVSEAFRSLRTNLDFASVDKPLRSILVTSSNPNEGKTTIAVNLAAIIAHTGKGVLLMDADMRKPQVHHFLGMSNRAGLSDLFRSNIPAIAVVQKPTGLSNVGVITSGSLPPNPTELLASARMDQILKEVTGPDRVVVIDSPPSLVADIQILAAKVDGVLMVIQPGHTAAPDARATLEQLNRVGAHMLGVVFNRIPRDRSYYYGGYRHYSPYYNSGYSYYTGEHSDKRSTRKATMPLGMRLRRLFGLSRNGKHHSAEKAASPSETTVK